MWINVGALRWCLGNDASLHCNIRDPTLMICQHLYWTLRHQFEIFSWVLYLQYEIVDLGKILQERIFIKTLQFMHLHKQAHNFFRNLLGFAFWISKHEIIITKFRLNRQKFYQKKQKSWEFVKLYLLVYEDSHKFRLEWMMFQPTVRNICFSCNNKWF